MAIDSCGGQHEIDADGLVIALFNALSQRAQRQRLGLAGGFLFGNSISQHARNFRNFSEPAPVSFLLMFNMKIHITSET